MAILVSDTSVIIDLERGSLLPDVFALPLEFTVPDLLFARELAGPLGDALIALGLRVESLSPAEVTRAAFVTRQNKNLSTADTFAFAIAEARGWTLLTGDGGLRNVATANAVQVHGVLWVCDQLERANVAGAKLHAGLTAISSHPRCRLPTQDVQERLARYQQ